MRECDGDSNRERGAKARPCASMGRVAPRGGPAPWPTQEGSPRGVRQSVSGGTRKMANYACTGRSQGKLWWRPATVLTCKSIVEYEHRGERLIEPSSSWFPPKCTPVQLWPTR